jgi:MFS family permease
LRRLPFYYGWVMVSALAISEPVSWGILFYGFGAMFTPTRSEMGWSSAQMTGAFSLAMLISGLVGVPVGRWLDRHGARGLMTLGSCLATLLVIAWANVQSLLAFYLVWAAIGVIMAMVLYEPAFAVVAAWFVRKRNAALTVLTFGGGLASVVFVPLATWLVQGYGWRMALWMLAGLLALVTIPIHALLLRRNPAAIGCEPDGERAATLPLHTVQPVVTNYSLHEAMQGAAFWWLSSAFSLSVFAAIALAVHLLPYLNERGYAPSFAALVASVLGGSQIPGRLVFGPLNSQFSLRMTTAALFAMMTAGVIILYLAPTGWMLLLGAMLFGAGSGASSPARAGLVAELYGNAHYGSISGVIALAQTVAKTIAPLGMGLLYTWWGGYAPVFVTLVAVSAGAVGSILLLEPQVRAIRNS